MVWLALVTYTYESGMCFGVFSTEEKAWARLGKPDVADYSGERQVVKVTVDEECSIYL